MFHRYANIDRRHCRQCIIWLRITMNTNHWANTGLIAKQKNAKYTKFGRHKWNKWEEKKHTHTRPPQTDCKSIIYEAIFVDLKMPTNLCTLFVYCLKINRQQKNLIPTGKSLIHYFTPATVGLLQNLMLTLSNWYSPVYCWRSRRCLLRKFQWNGILKWLFFFPIRNKQFRFQLLFVGVV